MTSDEKIAELKCIVSKIKQQNRLKFVGIVFSPLIIGIFLIRSATKKKTELINLKDNILDEVENETKIRINELICTYDSINDTFFIYRKKAELVGKCDLYLTYLQFFKKNKMLFNDNFNSFISESISIIVLLKDNFENYDNSYFIEKRILEYDYLFKKSPFPLDDSQKVSVITDDTHNLVVAGAGSGKTEVLITRIAYLIDRKPDTIDCEKILISCVSKQSC
ncbi:UvrD-helicase domain-containing protein [Methanococcoides seepicolus]|uniref:UvrD-helicase domain-containing protein n=1 Tax=Methanococcoides seepicolus TaxID=2828780 RepID=A0A9E5DBU7_9EURY|nr:UvrD-helicase domain-containing protein [Methanococcoides seepicolus]MCM1987970.1 UvrD-helicase domain-containing protein [Methanococcoides seepicolus]